MLLSRVELLILLCLSEEVTGFDHDHAYDMSALHELLELESDAPLRKALSFLQAHGFVELFKDYPNKVVFTPKGESLVRCVSQTLQDKGFIQRALTATALFTYDESSLRFVMDAALEQIAATEHASDSRQPSIKPKKMLDALNSTMSAVKLHAPGGSALEEHSDAD